MSKRALLWLIAAATMAFFYIAASYSGSSGCSTLDFTKWGHLSYCPLLPGGALLIGLVPSLVLVYFAEKGRPGPAELVGGHTVRYNSDEGLWICHDEKCSFTAATRNGARNHAVETGARPAGTGAAGTAKGFTNDTRSVAPATTSAKPVPQHSAPSVNSRPTPPSQAVGDAEYKTCPNCAEEVRTAARKCRFCGYEFVDTAASGLGA